MSELTMRHEASNPKDERAADRQAEGDYLSHKAEALIPLIVPLGAVALLVCGLLALSNA